MKREWQKPSRGAFQGRKDGCFYQFSLYWSEFSGKDFTRYFEEVGSFRWWYQWREWFGEVRGLVLKKIGEGDEEISTMEAIHKAMNYIREHMDRGDYAGGASPPDRYEQKPFFPKF